MAYRSDVSVTLSKEITIANIQFRNVILQFTKKISTDEWLVTIRVLGKGQLLDVSLDEFTKAFINMYLQLKKEKEKEKEVYDE